MKYLCCLVLMCLSLTTQAQRLRKDFVLTSKGLIDVQAGVSIPVLDFGLSKLTLPAGYATTGYTYKVGVSYEIAPYLGLAFQYQYMNNPFNESQYLMDVQQASTDLTYNSYRSNPWELRTTMIGLYYPFKTYRSSIDIRLLGGLCAGTYPESEANITLPQAPNAPFNFKDFETEANAFGFQAGVKMRYQVYKKLMLTLAADYTQTKIEFKDIRGIETTRNITYAVGSYTQQFQLINLTAGIGIQFE